MTLDNTWKFSIQPCPEFLLSQDKNSIICDKFIGIPHVVVDISLFPYLGNHHLIKLACIDTYEVVLALNIGFILTVALWVGQADVIIYDEIKDQKDHKTYQSHPNRKTVEAKLNPRC